MPDACGSGGRCNTSIPASSWPFVEANREDGHPDCARQRAVMHGRPDADVALRTGDPKDRFGYNVGLRLGQVGPSNDLHRDPAGPLDRAVRQERRDRRLRRAVLSLGLRRARADEQARPSDVEIECLSQSFEEDCKKSWRTPQRGSMCDSVRALQKVQAGFGTLTTPSLLSDSPRKTSCSRVPGEVS